MKRFYLTTTLPYVNAAPHIGFALEIVQADALARYARLMGAEVYFNTGTDEHGSKIYKKAVEEGKDPQAYVDEYAVKFKELQRLLNLDPALHFIRTTDPHHKAAAQEFWNRCAANGDIEKKLYKTKYCVGCELEKTDSELVDGRCPIHPNLTIETREEENYFFKFSKYGPKLLELYASRPDFVVPDFRLNEIKKFVEAGLQDFSISRLKEKMPWGVPVPGDEDHVMYVWFDALVNYISTLGWPEDVANFTAFWGTQDAPNAIQVAGKDNLRQQSAMWQAMLLSAGLPTSKQIVIHGFITSNGEKMSKSLGNVVDPAAIVQEYGADALRFWLLHDANPFEDSDFTLEKFKESYNANLANGLGNLTSRLMALAEKHLPEPVVRPEPASFPSGYTEAFEARDLKRASEFVWSRVKDLDQKIAVTEPFKLLKTDPEAGRALLTELIMELYSIARMLNPLLPQANEDIKRTILENKKPSNLFPRVP